MKLYALIPLVTLFLTNGVQCTATPAKSAVLPDVSCKNVPKLGKCNKSPKNQIKKGKTNKLFLSEACKNIPIL
jgi:hypothetical protein